MIISNFASLNPFVSSILSRIHLVEFHFLGEERCIDQQFATDHCDGNACTIDGRTIPAASPTEDGFLTKQSIVPDIGREPALRCYSLTIALDEIFAYRFMNVL